MSAAEQLEADHVVALGVRCERDWPSARSFTGTVGQLEVSVGYEPGRVDLELSGGETFAPVRCCGATLEIAEAALEQELFARSKALTAAIGALHLDAANDEPLSAEDAARLRREAEDCEQQERAREERAYTQHMRDVQRRVG